MNENNLLTIFDIYSVIMMVAIIVEFTLACIWNFKFLFITEKQRFSWIKGFAGFVCLAVATTYVFLLIRILLGNPIDTSIFGAIVIRLLIFAMGGVFASSARARLSSLKYGGEVWILRKYKI